MIQYNSFSDKLHQPAITAAVNGGCCCCCCCNCCSHMKNSHNQVRGHKIGSSHILEWRITPGKNTNKTKRGTRIYHIRRISCLRQENLKSEIGSQPTMCQVHTVAFVALLAPEKNDCTACHQEKTTEYILHVVSRYHYAYARQTQVDWKKEKRKEKTKKEKGYSHSTSPCDKPKQVLIALICCEQYIYYKK